MIGLILSVSRRTDIPAFYSEWFFNRLSQGYVLARNPISPHQVSRISLSPDVIDCIVFWTKNPLNMLDKIDLLSDYTYYFQITVNCYDNSIERNLPPKESVIKGFQSLSARIGRERTVWRYDPIILTDREDIEYHCSRFEKLASRLGEYTERCIISFVDIYRKSQRRLQILGLKTITDEDMFEIGKRLSEIGNRYGLKIMTCSEAVDLSSVGIAPAKCIDDRLISRLLGENIKIGKDKNQRNECGCRESIDIGAYNTCGHGCLYCYANSSPSAVRRNVSAHDPNSPMLVGNVERGDRITDRKMESFRTGQADMFGLIG